MERLLLVLPPNYRCHSRALSPAQLSPGSELSLGKLTCLLHGPAVYPASLGMRHEALETGDVCVTTLTFHRAVGWAARAGGGGQCHR